jgi:hypothetical protein
MKLQVFVEVAGRKSLGVAGSYHAVLLSLCARIQLTGLGLPCLVPLLVGLSQVADLVAVYLAQGGSYFCICKGTTGSGLHKQCRGHAGNDALKVRGARHGIATVRTIHCKCLPTARLPIHKAACIIAAKPMLHHVRSHLAVHSVLLRVRIKDAVELKDVVTSALAVAGKV